MKEFSQLVEAAQAGDKEAYVALVQRFQGMAHAMASRYVGDQHLAQDVVQDAIIEAFVHLPQLKEPSAFPGWFRQIVFRQCTRLLRQATLPSSSLEAASPELVTERDTEDLVMQAEREASVRSALASLPQHEQLVAALFYGCGYSYNEVSALLKIPITTVKNVSTRPGRSSGCNYRLRYATRSSRRMSARRATMRQQRKRVVPLAWQDG
jgi:RNA polymerase sigma-70 factor, ECF subfamily